MPVESGGVRGTVAPADGAFHALAVSAKDTAEVSVTLGSFYIPDLKPGIYTVIVVAHPPYGNYVNNHVSVTSGNITDLGQIQLPE